MIKAVMLDLDSMLLAGSLISDICSKISTNNLYLPVRIRQISFRTAIFESSDG